MAHLGFANPVDLLPGHALHLRANDATYSDVTDHPLGPGSPGQVRKNYTDPATKQGPLLNYLRTLGLDGEGADRAARHEGL